MITYEVIHIISLSSPVFGVNFKSLGSTGYVNFSTFSGIWASTTYIMCSCPH